jgi:hypothetical protein
VSDWRGVMGEGTEEEGRLKGRGEESVKLKRAKEEE